MVSCKTCKSGKEIIDHCYCCARGYCSSCKPTICIDCDGVEVGNTVPAICKPEDYGKGWKGFELMCEVMYKETKKFMLVQTGGFMSDDKNKTGVNKFKLDRDSERKSIISKTTIKFKHNKKILSFHWKGGAVFEFDLINETLRLYTDF